MKNKFKRNKYENNSKLSFNSGIDNIDISTGDATAVGVPVSGWYVVISIGRDSLTQGIQIAIGYFGTSKRYTRSFANGGGNGCLDGVLGVDQSCIYNIRSAIVH